MKVDRVALLDLIPFSLFPRSSRSRPGSQFTMTARNDAPAHAVAVGYGWLAVPQRALDAQLSRDRAHPTPDDGLIRLLTRVRRLPP